jgi:hypothetical protein
LPIKGKSGKQYICSIKKRKTKRLHIKKFAGNLTKQNAREEKNG